MKRNMFSFISGLLVGALLFGGVTAAAASGKSVTGLLRDITIYVNGAPVSVEAVNVADANYVKLRDVGEAVGFNVYWDGKVQVDTASPYTGKAPVKEESTTPGTGLDANIDIREVMIRRINEIRVQNGVPALPVSDVLMNAAQDISTQKKTQHGIYEWEIIDKHGWPYGGLVNLTSFSFNEFTNVGERAVHYWEMSAGHLQAMIWEDAACLGVGVTLDGDRAYCYMIVGDPDCNSPLN